MEERHHHHHRHRFHIWSRTQAYLSSFFHILSYGPIVALAFGVGFMPILYMGGEAWWLPVELLVALAGYFCWMLSYWWRGHRAGRPHFSLTMLFFALPLAYALFQCMPLGKFLAFLTPKGYSLIEGFNALGIAEARHSISVAPDSTSRYIMLLVVVLLFHFLALSHCSGRMKMRVMLLGIVAAALGNAGLSFYEFFTSSSKGIFSMPVFTGAFMNRNHFGFMMMLGTMCDLGLITGIVSDEGRHHHRHRRSRSSDGEYDWDGWRRLVIPLGLILFVLLTALLLSLSRGAFVGTTVSLLVFGIIWLFKSKEIGRGNRQMVLALMILVAASFIGAMPYAMDALSNRFEDLTTGEITMDGRWLVWKDSMKLIADYRLAGVGLG